MASSSIRRVQMVLMVGIVGFLGVACSQPSSQAKPQTKPTVRRISQALPPVVNGVPLLDLARHALGASRGLLGVQACGSSSRGDHAGGTLRAGPSRRRGHPTRVCRHVAGPLSLWVLRSGHADFDHDDRPCVGQGLDHGVATAAPPCRWDHDRRRRGGGHSQYGCARTGLQPRPLHKGVGRSQGGDRPAPRLGNRTSYGEARVAECQRMDGPGNDRGPLQRDPSPLSGNSVRVDRLNRDRCVSGVRRYPLSRHCGIASARSQNSSRSVSSISAASCF